MRINGDKKRNVFFNEVKKRTKVAAHIHAQVSLIGAFQFVNIENGTCGIIDKKAQALLHSFLFFGLQFLILFLEAAVKYNAHATYSGI